MAGPKQIIELAKRASVTEWLPTLICKPPDTPYDTPIVAQLPDGTPLDPFYSAKSFKYLELGDLFWPVGLRPIIAMPENCQQKFKYWKGPE
jgi:hypothetical protein